MQGYKIKSRKAIPNVSWVGAIKLADLKAGMVVEFCSEPEYLEHYRTKSKGSTIAGASETWVFGRVVKIHAIGGTYIHLTTDEGLTTLVHPMWVKRIILAPQVGTPEELKVKVERVTLVKVDGLVAHRLDDERSEILFSEKIYKTMVELLHEGWVFDQHNGNYLPSAGEIITRLTKSDRDTTSTLDLRYTQAKLKELSLKVTEGVVWYTLYPTESFNRKSPSAQASDIETWYKAQKFAVSQQAFASAMAKEITE
jgi:hypothetical protein